MTDTTTQLAILSDALVKIIDLCPLATAGKAEPADLLTRAGADRRRHLRSVAAIRGSVGASIIRRRQRVKRWSALRVKIEIAVDHGVHRIATRLKERKRGHNQCPSVRAARLWERDQAGMNGFAAEQGFEVADILGDDDAILDETGLLDRMIELAAPADMQRMDRVMAKFSEVEGKFWREAFVDKEPHPVTPRTARSSLAGREGDSPWRTGRPPRTLLAAGPDSRRRCRRDCRHAPAATRPNAP